MTTPRSSKIKTQLTTRDKKRLGALGDSWQLDDAHKKLVGTFSFHSYLEAFMFVTRIFVHAQVRTQFPDILLSNSKVKVTLIGSSSITTLQIDFAVIVSNLYLSTPVAPHRR